MRVGSERKCQLLHFLRAVYTAPYTTLCPPVDSSSEKNISSSAYAWTSEHVQILAYPPVLNRAGMFKDLGGLGENKVNQKVLSTDQH